MAALFHRFSPSVVKLRMTSQRRPRRMLVGTPQPKLLGLPATNDQRTATGQSCDGYFGNPLIAFMLTSMSC